MKTQSLTLTAAAAAITLALSACGGSSGGGDSGGTPTTSSLTSVGVITGFGSVFVNGVEYETHDSSISIDGVNSSESGLKVGMKVVIRGEINADGITGAANSIDFSDELEGLVNSNSIGAGNTTGTMVVMGQTVNVTAQTIFESDVVGINGVDDIVPGNIVEVSGFSSGPGSIDATRIEVKAADLATYLVSHDDIEVKGTVSNLTATTFDLGSLTVDYSGALLDDLPNGLSEGLYVEVKSVAGLDGGGNLVASEVELEDDGDRDHDGEPGEDMEIKGVISADFDGTTFAVDGQTILVDDGTELDEGLTTAQLVSGLMVEVEGHFNTDGDFVADEIETEDEPEMEIEGVVASVTTEGVNTGTVTLLDNTVILVNNDTIMLDDRDDGFVPDDNFNLTELNNSDFVEVDVYEDENGDLIAIKLEREDED